MSRYTIDGQILSDMADVVRLKKYGGEVVLVDNDVRAYSGECPILTIPYSGRKKLTINSYTVISGSPTASIFRINAAGDLREAILSLYSGTTLPATLYEDVGFAIFCSGGEVSVDIRLEPEDDITLTPAEMVDEVEAMEPIPSTALAVSGDCAYRFYKNGWNWLLDSCGYKMTSSDIINASYMFDSSNALAVIPFDINCKPNYGVSATNMFRNCSALTTAPMINELLPNGFDGMFSGCTALKTIPEGFGDNWTWSNMDNSTSSYNFYNRSIFYNCYSLRNVPSALINHTNPVISYSYSLYYQGFDSCYCLEEINDLAVPYSASWTSNAFNTTFKSCERLKNLTFKLQEDGTPYACPKWKNQVIDLTTVGYGQNCARYDTALTMDTYVDSVAEWEAAINGSNPNYWTSTTGEYTFYDRRAAVRTINTLPDVSGSGGTNTIKFKKSASGVSDIGSGLGDEGTISKLSDAEIAVAAAKGWTITFV